MRRFAAASAILAALLMPAGLAAGNTQPHQAAVVSGPSAGAASQGPAAAAGSTDTERAAAALQYLLAAQSGDGSVDGSIGETADFVIGAAAAGFDPATLRGCTGTHNALDFIATASDAAATDPNKTGKAILAVVAAGADPSSFSGRDLIARLNAVYHADTGKFGDGSTFGQAFAILALHASGVRRALSRDGRAGVAPGSRRKLELRIRARRRGQRRHELHRNRPDGPRHGGCPFGRLGRPCVSGDAAAGRRRLPVPEL